jgi:hypothetical protein
VLSHQQLIGGRRGVTGRTPPRLMGRDLRQGKGPQGVRRDTGLEGEPRLNGEQQTF